ncbi:MAG TPA: AlpA family phage regulatory protein [Casimicrobiaceae bacterium]|nr:AlpA family phage regulatory protein [Casimicrobiaceae bacterium]
MTTQVATSVQEVHEHPLAILRLPEVKARTGRSRSSIYADIKVGRFVPPINIGRRSVGWLAHEIDEWIAARIAESRGDAK